MRLHLQGQYSVERAFALEDYARSKPLSRAVLVCLATVAPPLAACLLFDVMPLREPSEGWERNEVLWIRLFGSALLLTLGILLQLQADVPAASMTMKTCLFVSVFTAGGYTVSFIPVANYWVFPIPFGFFFFMPSWGFFFAISMVPAIGMDNLRDNLELQTQLKVFAKQMTVASCFLPIYLSYQAVFQRLSGSNRLAFVFVLPVIKIVLKRVVVRVAQDQVDQMPARVASVDVFNAMYQSKCMQSTGSAWAIVAIIGIDAVQNLYSIHHLMMQVKTIDGFAGKTGTLGVRFDLLSQVSEALADPQQLDRQLVLALRTRSSTKIELRSEREAMLQRLDVAQQQARKRSSISKLEPILSVASGLAVAPAQTGKLQLLRSSTASVVPLVLEPKCLLRTAAPVLLNQVLPLPHAPLDRRHTSRVVSSALDLIWKCELLLLVEYIESAIPLLYAIYLSVLYRLPNAKYYPGTSEMSPSQMDSAVASILLYSGLEVASLAVVHMILKRKFNFSALHQLAFVFETEWALVQGVLVGWVVIVLQFTLMHYGVDLTFQFAWVHRSPTAS